MAKLTRPPVISVVIPVFNRVNDIETALKSVIEQEYEHIELIVKDAGSTDGTLELLDKYKDHIAKLIVGPDENIFDAMNIGMKAATGDWIIFLGSDDILVNNLHRTTKRFTNKNAVYYGNVYWEGLNLFYDGPFSGFKLCRININHQAIFYPRELMQGDPYEIRYHGFADYAYNVKHWYNPKHPWVYVPELVSVFAFGGNSSYDKDPDFYQDFNMLRNTYIHGKKSWRRLKERIQRKLDPNFPE